MKNKFLLSLLLIPMLVGCKLSETFVSRHPYPGDPLAEDDTDNPGGDDEPTELNQTILFYLDYSHSEEPIFEKEWYMLKPLGSCPEEALLTDEDASDPLYGHFLGYSEYSSSIDDSKLWNFETDIKQSNILKLYGIWVSN